MPDSPTAGPWDRSDPGEGYRDTYKRGSECYTASMARQTKVTLIGGKELIAAINRSPKTVGIETGKFLSRALSKYKKGIISRPWRLGSNGGGAPRDTGNLADTHVTKVSRYKGVIEPGHLSKKYAYYVHEGTRRMEARPWLDYVKQANEHRIRSLYLELLKNITRDLAK